MDLIKVPFVMRQKRSPVAPGDLFRKNERYESIWKVTDLMYLAGYPPHVHIARIDDPTRPLAYAVAALNDQNLFVRCDKRLD